MHVLALVAAASLSVEGSSSPMAMPLAARLRDGFERNAGQFDPAVRFAADGRGYRLFLTDEEAVFVTTGRSVVRMRLRGAQRPPLEGEDAAPARANYLRGPRTSWHTDVPRFAQVRSRGVYAGIDRVFHCGPAGLEYDFVVQPGADPASIVLEFEGATPKITEAGALALDTPEGTLIQRLPLAYQDSGGRRETIAATYVVEGRTVRIRTADYDRARPLVIDPLIDYSTYLGGSDQDYAMAVAVDPRGSAYVVGRTCSVDFPVVSALQPLAFACDAFVAKLDPTGTTLVYSTYIGGSADDGAEGVALGRNGEAFVVGLTFSKDFPVSHALQPTYHGGGDGFVLELDPSGASLLYSTYLGGRGYDNAAAVAVDRLGQAHVVGTTESSSFPTVRPAQGTFGGGIDDAFVAKLSASGGALLYSTYLGGTASDEAFSVAIDNDLRAWVAGGTWSGNFPLRTPYQAFNAGARDAFVTGLSAAGGIVYSTYLGGIGEDAAYGIAMDTSARPVVVGATASANFPLASPLQAGLAGGRDAFVARLDTVGLEFSTYLGGAQDDWGYAVAIDAGGAIHVAGTTSSASFPTVSAVQAFGGTSDAFVAALDPTGTALIRSTFLGGADADGGRGLALDPAAREYVVGYTLSTGFPVVNALQPFTASPGLYDAFVTRLR